MHLEIYTPSSIRRVHYQCTGQRVGASTIRDRHQRRTTFMYCTLPHCEASLKGVNVACCVVTYYYTSIYEHKPHIAEEAKSGA